MDNFYDLANIYVLNLINIHVLWATTKTCINRIVRNTISQVLHTYI
jgi:hypothetical protein